jgi:hypothetical protein
MVSGGLLVNFPDNMPRLARRVIYFWSNCIGCNIKISQETNLLQRLVGLYKLGFLLALVIPNTTKMIY